LNSATAVRLKELKTNMSKGVFKFFSRIAVFFNFLFTAFDKQITSQRYIINIDGKDYSGHYSLIHIANGPYFAGKKTGATEATPDDGLLDVTLIKSAGPFKTMRSMNRYSRGKRIRNGVTVQAKKISVHSERQMWIQMDNEYFQDTKIDVGVVHHAIQMVALDKLTYPLATISAY
jgi:diacylglycerol kinase family enzyme